MITREFPPLSGGIGYYVYYLSKKLIQRGHEVRVITRSPSFNYSFEKIDGIDVYGVPFLPIYPFHLSLHGYFVNKILRSFEKQLAIIHLHSPLPPPIKTSIPVLTTFHSSCKRAFDNKYRDSQDLRSIAEQLQTKVIYPPIENKILNFSGKITVVSSNVGDELSAYGINKNAITVVGNAVDTELFVPEPAAIKIKPNILFVGILRSGKGVFELLKCAKLVCDKRPDARFFICGSGPLLRSLHFEVLKAGLERNVIFLGYVNRKNLIKLYQTAMVLLHPSSHEGLSTVILEAMACGLPVVASDIPGNRVIISHSNNGLLVSRESPTLMADAILKLIKDAEIREKLGKAARVTIEEKYSWDKITDNIVECYRDLLRN